MAARMAKTHWMGARVSSVLFLVPLLVGAGFASSSDPIVEAAKDGDIETVRHLIESGADVNVAGGAGMTPLHWAAERGDLEITRLLLESGPTWLRGPGSVPTLPCILLLRGDIPLPRDF